MYPFVASFIPIITNFGDLGDVSPHFKTTTVKFSVRVRTWESLSHAKLVKKPLRGLAP